MGTHVSGGVRGIRGRATCPCQSRRVESPAYRPLAVRRGNGDHRSLSVWETGANGARPLLPTDLPERSWMSPAFPGFERAPQLDHSQPTPEDVHRGALTKCPEVVCRTTPHLRALPIEGMGLDSICPVAGPFGRS